MSEKTPSPFPGVRLLAAAAGSLLLLCGMAFPIFSLLGRGLDSLVPAVLCVLILVILMPVMIWGTWRDRLLALLLAVFPLLLLLSIIVFTLAFAR